MNIAARVEGRIVVLEVEGDVDGKTSSSFQEQVLARIDPEGRVLLDLSRVGFMSSAGLRVLLLTYREVESKKARAVLVGMNDGVRTSMSATGFLKFFTVRESLAEGLSALE
jgi:anti-sigma B factor antagonist